jgi:hypothetical protein
VHSPGSGVEINISWIAPLVLRPETQDKVTPMNILIVAEHDNKSIMFNTRRAMMAAAQIVLFTDAQVHMAIIGHEAKQVAEESAEIAGVAQVIHIDGDAFANSQAEDVVVQIGAIAPAYVYILFAATTWGRHIAQHLAVELGVTPINNIASVKSADSFEYATHANLEVATVQSTDGISVLTVCPSRFEAVPATGGLATVQSMSGVSRAGRPELILSRSPWYLADDEPFCGYNGLMESVESEITHESRQFVCADKKGARGPDLLSQTCVEETESAS